MKNVYEVLRDKENELASISKLVYALRLVAPLLADTEDIKAAIAEEAKPESV